MPFRRNPITRFQPFKPEKDIRLFIHSMPHTLPSDLKERIIIALTDHDSELWFPHLTYDLMQTGLQKLYEETGITQENYGTARVILKDADAERVFERSVFTVDCLEDIKNKSFIEMLPASFIEEYKKS